MALNRYLIVFLLVSVFLPGHAQKKIDSLKSLLVKTTGVHRVEILRDLGYEYLDVDNEVAKQYGSEGYKIATRLNNNVLIVKAGRILAAAKLKLGLIDSAIQIYNTLIPIAKQNELTGDLPRLLNFLGISYLNVAQYDKALNTFFEALAVNQQSQNTDEIESLLINIGLVYYKLKNYDKSLVYWQECLTSKSNRNDHFELSLLLINIALSYAYKNDLENAKHYIGLAIEECAGECSPRLKVASTFCLGIIHFNSNNFHEAEMQFLKSYRFAEDKKNTRYQFDNVDYLTQISIRRNKFYQAIEYLKEAEKLIKEGVPYNLEVIKIYAQFLKVYSLTKNYKEAAYYQQKYIQLKDSIYSEELTANLMKVEAEYQERENKAKITSQNYLLVLKEQVIANQNLLNVAVFSMVIVLVVLAVILFRSNRQRKAINRLLELKVKERTKTLEMDQAELIKACKERDLLLERTVEQVRTSVVSINGICINGLIVPGDVKALRYFKEVEETSNSLSNALKLLQEHKRNFTVSK